jgi:hypothetical protein
MAWGLGLLALAAAFALGVALGQALEDNRNPGDRVTRVRTVPPPREAPTVTATVTATP